jgi:HemX protein
MSVSPEGLLLLGSAIAYLVSSVSYGASLFLERASGMSTPMGRPKFARGGLWAVAAAAVLHTLSIGAHCALTHRTPFVTPAETLSASAWAIGILVIVLNLTVKPAPIAVSAVALPAAFLCLFTGAVLDPSYPRQERILPALDSHLISLHVIALIFAFGMLVLAFGCTLLYLAQHRILKHKQVRGGLFGKLPPLAILERQEYALVALAFPLLSIGLLAGVIRAAGGGWPIAAIMDLKVLASAATWSVYGVYLLLHSLAHWRGPRANYLLLGGFVVAVCTFFAPSSIHAY